MVIDTSAVLAILFGESNASALVAAIAKDSERMIGAPTLVETSAVILARKGPAGVIALDAFLHRALVRVEPMSPSAADIARQAYAQYGKGIGSPAVLNFGDCLSYGIAKSLGQRLLFVGDDFAGVLARQSAARELQDG